MWAVRAFEVAARLDAAGVVGWYLADLHGSVRLISDNAGSTIGSQDYTGFGAITLASGAGLDRYAYAGREWDATLGLQYDRARLYDPATGRFTSEDPLGLWAGDVNVSRYVGNTPTLYSDPSGMSGRSIAVGAGIGGAANVLNYLVRTSNPTPGGVARHFVTGAFGGAFASLLQSGGLPSWLAVPAGAGLTGYLDSLFDQFESGSDFDPLKTLEDTLTPAAEALWFELGLWGAGKAAKAVCKTSPVQRLVRSFARPAENAAPAARRTLPGHTEWVPDPRRAGTATRELPALEATYTRETGLRPDLARRRPLGETKDAGFDPKTGEIFVYDDVPPAFRDGYLAEELHHYQQVRDAGHLGKTLAEIEKSDPGFAVRMERDVLGRVRGSGFIPYDPRHYAPYTDVPRPPGVAGDTTR
jgi:RHS repeat-associated protein